MNANEAAKKVTEYEGLKKQISIAQVKEVMRILNELTGKKLYKLLKECNDEK